MKIVHISSSDITGGAARAAHRLHEGLRRIGEDSFMFVVHRASRDPHIRQFQPAMDLRNRLLRKLRRSRIRGAFEQYRSTRPMGVELFSDDRSAYGADFMEQLPDCDVINLHWVAGFLDYRAFFEHLPEYVPVVWTLHDMNAFTGGCHYDNDCRGFTKKCGKCPQLGSDAEEDLSREVWQDKRDVFTGIVRRPFQVVADSHWLAREAGWSSLLSGFPVTTIHYGIDIERFAPRDRGAARSLLGIPKNAFVILFAAANVDNRRKGFRYLLEALEGMSQVKNPFLLSFGAGEEHKVEGIPSLALGPVNQDRYLSMIYSAADIFVIPSLQEAFGQTALEAMSCGVPVVGSDVGGIPDIVADGVTGKLVAPGDVSALRTAIEALAGAPDKLVMMSSKCRSLVENRFAIDIQAHHYAGLYQKLLGEKESKQAELVQV